MSREQICTFTHELHCVCVCVCFLQAIVLAHWLLTIWACSITWLPTSYVLGNVSALAVGVWAIAQRDSIDAVLMFLIVLAVTILTDIVHFGLYYAEVESHYERNLDLFRFCGGMAILSLLLKPVSCVFVYQMYRERGGEYNVNFGKWYDKKHGHLSFIQLSKNMKFDVNISC
uniref:Angiotensin II receptor-associated protein n=1 Tax=Sinocyclocheilus anshuiensis TaxID=1608454 RepID=A0A671QXS5_9TELE